MRSIEIASEGTNGGPVVYPASQGRIHLRASRERRNPYHCVVTQTVGRNNCVIVE
jgi:hypothetical protein